MKRKLSAIVFAALLLLALAAPAAAAEPETRVCSGLCALDDGTMLVTDTYNKVVWRVEPGGAATLLAGKPGAAGADGEPVGGYRDGAAGEALFREPWAIAPFLDGWAVTDSANNVVRYVTEARVETLAGSGSAGRDDGIGADTAFSRPTGLAADDRGGLFVADTGNGAIRYIASNGRVRTVLTGLNEPTGLCWAEGALYAAETGENRILKIVDGAVTERWGVSEAAEDPGETYGGYRDGPVAAARFDHPQGVACADGAVYVADTGNSALRVIRDGRVYTLSRGDADSALPVKPRGLCVSGGTLCAADAFAGELVKVPLEAGSYSDVPADAPYADAARELTARGILRGTGGGAFSPEMTYTRAMFVTMISRIHTCYDGAAVIDGDGGFTDVPDGEWFTGPVRWAVDLGVTNGVGGGCFDPTGVLTTEQLITLLHRYAVALGVDVSVGEDTNILSYDDALELSDWAIPALQWGCGAGVLRNTDGSLHHAEPVTRAAAAEIMLRFMDVCGL